MDRKTDIQAALFFSGSIIIHLVDKSKMLKKNKKQITDWNMFPQTHEDKYFNSIR